MLVVIPARGGSKGVPGKNIKMLGEKPLILHTVDAARDVFRDDQILVSTDSVRIKEIVEASGLAVPFLRPAELATDTCGTQEVLLHALGFMEQKGIYNEVLVLLQPTSPFRNATHIQEALNAYHEGLDMLVSVKETGSNPYYVLREENQAGFLEHSKVGNFKTRQDAPKVWELNGAIYVINIQSLKSKPMAQFEKVKKYVMDEQSSHDIDTPLDWQLAEILHLLLKKSN